MDATARESARCGYGSRLSGDEPLQGGARLGLQERGVFGDLTCQEAEYAVKVLAPHGGGAT